MSFPHITETNTDFMSTQQFQRNPLLLWFGLGHSCLYIERFLSVSLSSPPLIEGRWIIRGLFHYLTYSLGRKIHYF